MGFHVEGDPHPWPRAAGVGPGACALLVVDMQDDYCSPGYYIAQAGYDTERPRCPVEPIRQVLAAARAAGMPVIYTQHARAAGRPHEPPEAPAHEGPPGPRVAARGEPGWHILPELRPRPEEPVIEKSTCSAFVSGELDRLLRRLGIRHLALCGNTIDVCVHSTLRAAVDLGYECLLLGDCCAAVNDGLHRWAIESVRIEDGVFGTVAGAGAFVRALARPGPVSAGILAGQSGSANPGSAGPFGPAGRSGTANPGSAGIPAGNPAPKSWYSRGYLPHLDQPDLLQAITFRLHDAVPAHVVEQWKEDLLWLEGLPQADRRVVALRERMVQYEDAGNGSCWLWDERIAALVEDALLHFDGRRYRLLAWCVMPNHVHVLVETLPGQPLEGILHSWKSYTAQQANRLLARSGEFWAREYHDRFIRDDRHLAQAVAYIEQNPVKAGLVALAEEWPFGSAARRAVG